MATDFDPYRILEVDPSASQEEIDEAYRRHWAEYPRPGWPEERLREIQAAYRILSDPAERRSYDQRRASTPTSPTAVATRVPFESEYIAPASKDEPIWTPGDVLRAVLAVLGISAVALVIFSLAAVAVAGDSNNIDESAWGTGLVLVVSIMFQAAALGSVWWFGIRKYGLSWKSLGLRPPVKGYLWLPIVIVIAAMTMQGIYGLLLSLLDVSPDTDLPNAMFENAIPLAMLITTTLLIAPIVEEIFFRGFVFGGLNRKWGFVRAAFVSSSLFGLAHVGNPGYLVLLPLVGMLGAMFAWAFYYSRSLYTTIVTHMIFNSIAIITTLATR